MVRDVSILYQTVERNTKPSVDLKNLVDLLRYKLVAVTLKNS